MQDTKERTFAYLRVEGVVVLGLLHVHPETPDNGVDDPCKADSVHGEIDPLALVEVLSHVPREEGEDRRDNTEQDVVELRREQVGGCQVADEDVAHAGVGVGRGRRVQPVPDGHDDNLDESEGQAEDYLPLGTREAGLSVRVEQFVSELGEENPVDAIRFEQEGGEHHGITHSH